MLGSFSIRTAKKQISDRDNRSRKIWLLLAYMIYHRHRVVLPEECINLLWGETEPGANPSGAFKTMVHRLRTMLDTLWPTAGHDLILYQNGGYVWNKEANVELDIEKFDELCHRGSLTEEEQIQRDFQALQLYQGDFLSHMSSEAWVIPIAAYYHNCYIQSLLRVLPVLFEEKRYSEAAELCQVASIMDPFHEEIHCYLMKALLYMGDQKGAANIYKKMSERLSSNFGIMP
jgi:DNA-binding SARP family transcriptional activator